MGSTGEYAQVGVDYIILEPFKRAMMEAGRRTLNFPNRRGVYMNEEVLHAHGALFEYRGSARSHTWCQTIEGLGNKNWLAEWMYQFSGTGRTFYDGIGVDVAMMAVNDCIAQGAMPVSYTDEVAGGDSEWFEDETRARDLAVGFYKACKMAGMAMSAGESSSLRYLVNAGLPVTSAPSLSGCVVGIAAPNSRLITGEKLGAADDIIGVTSSGLHANGATMVITRGLSLPERFVTKLPNGNTLGAEALIPTRSYVALVEALLEAGVDIHALLPGTGSGVSKVAFDDRPFTYRIHSWVEVPPLFLYMQEEGVSLKDCLTTFNWGVGYYIFVAPKETARVIEIGEKAGYEMALVGLVEEGERKVIFEPEGITLAPPGE